VARQILCCKAGPGNTDANDTTLIELRHRHKIVTANDQFQIKDYLPIKMAPIILLTPGPSDDHIGTYFWKCLKQEECLLLRCYAM
jgi:hypothetical protein